MQGDFANNALAFSSFILSLGGYGVQLLSGISVKALSIYRINNSVFS